MVIMASLHCFGTSIFRTVCHFKKKLFGKCIDIFLKQVESSLSQFLVVSVWMEWSKMFEVNYEHCRLTQTVLGSHLEVWPSSITVWGTERNAWKLSGRKGQRRHGVCVRFSSRWSCLVPHSNPDLTPSMHPPTVPLYWRAGFLLKQLTWFVVSYAFKFGHFGSNINIQSNLINLN